MKDRVEGRRTRVERPEELLRLLPPAEGVDELVTSAMDVLHREGQARREEAVRACCPESGLRELPVPETSPHVIARLLGQLQERAPRVTRRDRPWIAGVMPRHLVGAAAAVCLVVGAVVLWAVSPAGVWSPEPVPTAFTQGLADVQRMIGAAQLIRDGRVVALAEGQSIADRDVIQTEPEAELELDMGAGVRLLVDGDSKLRFAAALGATPQLDILEGRVEVHVGVASDSRAAIVHRDQVLAVVRGRVGILRVGVEQLTAVAIRDEAQLTIGASQVLLPADHLVTLGENTEAVVPEPLPDELVLSLRQQSLLRPGGGEVVILGTTTPGVVLIINRQSVPVDEKGRFVAKLALPANTESVEGVVRDALGREQKRTLQLERVSTRTRWTKPG